MTKIKLVRVGRRKKPTFRLVVVEHRSTGSRAKEYVGLYDPRNDILDVDLKRISYWIRVGAQLSPGATAVLKKYERSIAPIKSAQVSPSKNE